MVPFEIKAPAPTVGQTSAMQAISDRGDTSPIVVAAWMQVVLLLGLVWFWSGDHDATATTVDWGPVVLILATPTVLAGSFLVGKRVRQRSAAPPSRLGRVFAWSAQTTTLLSLVPTAVLALPIAMVAIIVEPIG